MSAKRHLKAVDGGQNPILFPVMVDTGAGGVRPAKDHIGNTKALMDHYGFSARFNVMARAMELTLDGELVAEGQGRVRAKLENRCAEHQLSRTAVEPHLLEIADPYHPVADWLDADVGGWDGVDRFAQVASTLHLRRGYRLQTLAYGLLRTWCRLAAAMATATERVPVAQGALTLQGVQGAGKTRWLEALAGKSDFFLSGIHLDPSDKDSVARATSRWIVELGEIDGTFRKADVAALKAFITKDKDTYRVPYGRTQETFVRRTAFCATVNPQHFLVDETGNRRWWTIPVDFCDVAALQQIDVRQFWLQMRQEVKGGAITWLSPELAAELNESNLDHEAQDPLIAELAAQYEPDPLHMTSYTVQRFVSEVDMLAKIPVDRRLSVRIGKAMSDAGIEAGKVGGNRVWYCRPRFGR